MFTRTAEKDWRTSKRGECNGGERFLERSVPHGVRGLHSAAASGRYDQHTRFRAKNKAGIAACLFWWGRRNVCLLEKVHFGRGGLHTPY